MVRKVTPHPKPRKAKHFVREWRKFRRLTQEQLAERIEQTSGAISQLENGLVNYTQPTLEAIAHALNCEPGDLLSRDPFKEGDVVDLVALLRQKDPETVRAILQGLPSVDDKAS